MEPVVVQVTDMLVEFVTTFGEVATTDPISAILLLFGAVFVTVSSAVFGLLTVGALLSPLGGSGGIGRSPPPEAK